MNYSNPRLHAVIDNWPSGARTVQAVFAVESDPKKGQRATRTTTGATKKLTYARKVRIVDGDDGRTYLAHLSPYGQVMIMKGDMKYFHESFFEDNPRYHEMLRLFD